MTSATASGGHGGQSLSLAPPNANLANSGSTSPFNSSSAPNFPLTPTKFKEEEKRIQMVTFITSSTYTYPNISIRTRHNTLFSKLLTAVSQNSMVQRFPGTTLEKFWKYLIHVPKNSVLLIASLSQEYCR